MRVVLRCVAAVAGCLVFDAVASAVTAQEYCVSCSEPNATYRCVIIDPKPGLAQSLQASCLTALARDGRHGRCVIKQGVTVFECDAPVKRVSVSGTEALPAGPAPVGPVVVAPPPPPAPDLTVPPKTMLEAAQRATQATDAQMRASGDKLKDAGNSTASFFKKSLTCLGTLFTKCEP
jgi:hypothetical protein